MKGLIVNLETQDIKEVEATGMPFIPPPIDIQKEQKMRELKSYTANLLSQTDYVLLKIQEAQTLGEDINTLLQKYKPTLDKRKAIRDWYDKVKQDISNATTVEQLEGISIEFMG